MLTDTLRTLIMEKEAIKQKHLNLFLMNTLGKTLCWLEKTNDKVEKPNQ